MTRSFFVIPSTINIDKLLSTFKPAFAPFSKRNALLVLEHISVLHFGKPIKVLLSTLRQDTCDDVFNYLQWFAACNILTLSSTSRSLTVGFKTEYDSIWSRVVYNAITDKVVEYKCLSWQLRQKQMYG